VSGILDSKKRVIDAVVTQEGKRQISLGGLRAVYATVSDKCSYYEKDIVSGSADATKRIYFESPIENINDSITMETDDSGKLLGYPVRGEAFYNIDGAVEGLSSISGTLVLATNDTATGFASLATGIITQSLDRFRNLMSLGTRDSNEPDNLATRLNRDNYTFTLTNNSPFFQGKLKAITDVDFLEPLFFDERLSNVINFKFLPPIIKDLTKKEKKDLDVRGKIPNRKKFGNYTKVSRPWKLTYQDIIRHLNTPTTNDVIPTGGVPTVITLETPTGYTIEPAELLEEPTGSPDADADADFDAEDDEPSEPSLPYEAPPSESYDGSTVLITMDQPSRERVPVIFKSTSNTNNLVMQLFELNETENKLKKLDVIDFGIVEVPSDKRHPTKQIFFAGKIFINSINLPCYVNLFTIIMD